MSERSDLDDDLRATADSIIDDADQLRRLEVAKRSMSPVNPALTDISRRVEDVAEEILHKARVESSLAERRTAEERFTN
jgi:hypothetical protein